MIQLLTLCMVRAAAVGRCLPRAVRLTACVLAVLLSAASSATAQAWYLENHGYFEPILAEPRAAQSSVVFPARADSFPFAVKDRAGVVWDISVGKEFPIFGVGSAKATEDPRGVAARRFGWGMWFPLSFHMIEDMGKDPSNPILNTDYRFSGLLKFQYGLPGAQPAAPASHIGAKLQFGHESTHIGDEFELGALQYHGSTFQRVNVSYEYWDAAGTFEPTVGPNELKFRVGDIWLWHPDRGWYDPSLLQPFGTYIARSSRNHEPYVQVEFNRPSPSWLSHRCQRCEIIASLDLRDRTIFQYLPAGDANHTNPEEPTQWSMNLLVGLRHLRSGAGALGKIDPTYFVRVYHGVNPNGQFRSQPDFDELGFGVHFRF